MKLQITYTRTRNCTPLVELQGGPFNGAEFTPEDLHALAHTLTNAANFAKARPCLGRHWMQQRVTLDTLANTP